MLLEYKTAVKQMLLSLKHEMKKTTTVQIALKCKKY